MPIPRPAEFFTLNNTRVGAVAGTTLASADGNDYYCDPAKVGQGWDHAADMNRALSAGSPFTTGGDWTVSVWFQKSAWTTTFLQFFRLLNADGSGTGISLAAGTLLGAGKVRLNIGGSAVTVNCAADTNWHNVIVRHTASTPAQKVIVDGGTVGAGSIANPAPLTTPTLYLGTGPSSAHNGKLDAVGWWGSALADELLAELYNAGAGWEYEPTPPDNTPDAFSFANVLNAEPATQYESDPAEVTGMDAGTAVSVTGGEYRINGGAWTSDAGTIDPGDTLELRGTSSADPETETIVAVTVGTLTVEWSITTAAAQTLKQHLIVSRDGIIQPVGACVIVPGWV